MSLRLRVNRRTSPARRWACTLAPSSFHSTDASPVSASASATPVRRRGEHRADRPPRHERDRSQGVDAAGERLAGGLAEVAREHVGAAHLVERDAGAAGDGVDHHPVECALAQLAAEHTPQQPLLGRRRPGEHGGQQVAPPSRRARPGLGGEVAQPSIDLEHLERRLVGVGGVELAQRRPPDADAPLARLAGEQTDGDGRLVRASSTAAAPASSDVFSPRLVVAATCSETVAARRTASPSG